MSPASYRAPQNEQTIVPPGRFNVDAVVFFCLRMSRNIDHRATGTMVCCAHHRLREVEPYEEDAIVRLRLDAGELILDAATQIKVDLILLTLSAVLPRSALVLQLLLDELLVGFSIQEFFAQPVLQLGADPVCNLVQVPNRAKYRK